MKNKILLLLLVGFFSITSVKAQVLWDFRGGISYNKIYELGYGVDKYKKNAFYYLGELGIDIPIKEQFAIEIALRYKNIFHVDSYKSQGYNDYDYNKAYWEYRDDWEDEGRASLLELPMRFGYKIPLFKNTLVRVGAGPYVSAGLNGGFRLYQAGISTALTYEYKKINAGLNYNIAVHNGFENEGRNGLFLTLGVKFKSSTWKSIGAVTAVVGGTALIVGSAIAATGNDSGNSSDFTSYNSYENTDTKNSSDSEVERVNSKSKQLEKQSYYMRSGDYDRDSRSYTGREDQLRNMKENPERFSHLSNEQFCREVKDLQSEMKKIREKITKNGGTRTKASLEDWAPKRCQNY